MCKSPVEAKDFERVRSRLVIDWDKVLNNYSSEVQLCVNAGFKSVNQKAFSKIMSEVKSDSRLTDFDEKIYQYYKELIEAYRRAAEIYRENSAVIASDSIKKLLEGLFSVLCSRINQFEESHTVVDCKENKDGIINPVYIEKKQITKVNLNEFISKTNELKRRFADELLDCPEFELSAEKLNRLFSEKYSELVIEYYKNISVKCINQLNDIEKRDVTYFYYSMLKEEKELLSSVITVQVDALEKAEQSAAEGAVIQKILFELRQSYQYVNKREQYLFDCFKKVKLKENTAETVNWLEGFRLFKDGDLKKTNADIQRQKNEFKDKLCRSISECAGKKTSETLYIAEGLRNKSDNCVFTAKELSDEFAKITAFPSIPNEGIEENCADIIKGIMETVTIKIESINEAADLFCDEINKKFDFLNTTHEISISEAQKQDIFKRWLIAPNKTEIFDSLVTELLELTIGKKMRSSQEQINKKITAFMREGILYEVSTFEEIMNYSIPRLRENDSEYVCEYVKAVDMAAGNITQILKRYGVEIIRPEVHNIFNGREHEVIMAEKNADFNKGEIIKVMSCGYKMNGSVIMRANIIAAK